MNKHKKFITSLLVLTIIMLALAATGSRLGLANIQFFKSDIEAWMARDITPGIAFSDIHAGWKQTNPVLRLDNATITPGNGERTLAIEQMSVEFDIWKSLLFWSPVVREISGTISTLSLTKDTNHQWWLNEFSLSGSGGKGSEFNIQQLIEQIPYYTHLELKQLILFNQVSGETHQIDNIQIDVQQRDESYYLKLDASLPLQLGGNLKFKSIISPENSVGYIKSDRLELDHLASLFGINIGGIQQAELGGEAWVSLTDEGNLALSGNISVHRGIFLPPEASEPVAFSLDSQIHASLAENRWRIRNRFGQLSINDNPLQGFETELRVATEAGRVTTIEGWANDFELYNLRVLDEQRISDRITQALGQSRLIPARISQAPGQSQLRGQLHDLWFSLDPSDIRSLQFMTGIANLDSKPVNRIPGISQTDAKLVFGHQNAGLEITGEQMTLDFGDFFRAPLEIDRFNLKANISLIEGGLLLSAPEFEAVNSDIKASGRLRLEADNSGKPFLYLRARMEDGKGSSTPKYLPVTIMPEKVVNWLDQGIKAVDVSNGHFLYHGRLESIQSLEQNKSGEMMVAFDIDNSEVLFDPKWTPAHGAKGEVMFHNMGVDIDLDRVGFESINDASATISIADYKNTIVEVKVDTSIDTDTALRTALATPVGRKYESVMKNLHGATGTVEAEIALSLPVKKAETGTRVDVKLAFGDAAIKAKAWGLEFTQINGDLHISEQGISSQGIKALYYNDPIVLKVGTDQKRQQTVISTHAMLDSRQLFNLLPEYLKKGFSGSSEWGLRIGIANKKPDHARPIVQIRAASTTRGTQVSLPAPFAKPVNSNRPVAIIASIFEDGPADFYLTQGSAIKLRGQLKPDAENGYQLTALGLGLSTGLRPLPETGIHIYGSLEKLLIDEWADYFQTRIAVDHADTSEAILMVGAANLQIKSTSFRGHTLTDISLDMIQEDSQFVGTIESSLMKGDFVFPLQHSPQNPIVADLEYLDIQKQDAGSETAESNTPESNTAELLPQDFPNLKILSKAITFGRFQAADFQLDTRVEDNLLRVETLAFRHNKLSLTSSADWQYLAAEKQHSSTLNMSIAGKQLGQSIAALGFGDTMHNGEVTMAGQTSWSGKLFDMDWDSLKGDVRLEITDGTLKNVDPGSGRLVGLLSVNALPKRLALDFGDVLFDGMSFNKISGSYNIEGENMYTTDTNMDGASARVRITGRIGLRQRDYDQTLVVIPKIRQTLPILGGLAAGNTVGWGILLIQKLFKKAIDKSVEVEYKVTGPWETPRVDLVKKEILKKETVPNEK